MVWPVLLAVSPLLLLAAFYGALAWWHRRRSRAWSAQLEAVHKQPWIWRCSRVGGGGVFDTPPLLRTEALDYVTRQGTHQIVFVDDDHKFIFYRSL
jgi:hypothetical protein